MQDFATLYVQYMPTSMLPIAIGMLATGLTLVAYFVMAGRTERGEVRKRLTLAPTNSGDDQPVDEKKRKKDAVINEKTLKKAEEFYAKNDPESVMRLRMQLIQAGFMDPGAPGLFFAARFALVIAFSLIAFIVMSVFMTDVVGSRFWVSLICAAAFGYIAPTLFLSWCRREKMREYRNGFPDFLDLMIVCSDAGMSMDAAIERVSREIEKSYPSLSQNLALLSIELRAGRVSNDAMKSLGERMGLDEVRSFATLIQQSRELGTSLSGALRVFSDEMRHKRMSKAEEKAHSLPAKMSVPVTMCILPVVLLIAVIPIVAKMTNAE
ncbi:MAG: type II secretion system F family protein [Rhizobiaceae bacterium]